MTTDAGNPLAPPSPQLSPLRPIVPAAPPTLGKHFAWLLRETSIAEVDKLIDDCCDDATDKWHDMAMQSEEAAVNALKLAGRIDDSPEGRYAYYSRKPYELWQQYSLVFPQDYDKDWADFLQLQQRFGPVVLT